MPLFPAQAFDYASGPIRLVQLLYCVKFKGKRRPG
jgi:hypothetical protein